MFGGKGPLLAGLLAWGCGDGADSGGDRSTGVLEGRVIDRQAGDAPVPDAWVVLRSPYELISVRSGGTAASASRTCRSASR